MTISVRVFVEDSRGPNVEVGVYQQQIGQFKANGEYTDIPEVTEKFVGKLWGGGSLQTYVTSDTKIIVKELKNG